MLKIFDGRNEFYQWDLNQRLIVDDSDVTEVHYCNQTDDCSLVCEVYEEGEQRLVNIPNILFQEALPIRAYAYAECCTKESVIFAVKPRSKPIDYVYTETEVRTWSIFNGKIEEEIGRAKNAEAEIRNQLSVTDSIAKGASQAVSYGNYKTMIMALDLFSSDVFRIGQSILIVTVDVPDLWVSAVAEKPAEYKYTSDEEFVSSLKESGSVQVGYYVLSQLETQKVNISEYLKEGEVSYNDLKDKPFGDCEPININFTTANGSVNLYEGAAFLQTEKTYSVEELLGATVEYYNSGSRLSYATISRKHITDENSYGVTITLSDTVRIYVVYNTEYQALGLHNDSFPQTGVYFTDFDNGDPNQVTMLTKKAGIKFIANEYLDLEHHPVIEAILARLN